jgi:hypothetical protein
MTRRSTRAGRTAKTSDNVANTTTESPLDYMLRVMRDPGTDDERRDAMAKAALPYMHARLTSVDGQVPDNEGGPVSFTWKPPQK